jgi:hypothetical protein
MIIYTPLNPLSRGDFFKGIPLYENYGLLVLRENY